MHLSQCMDWLVKKLQWVAKNVVVSAGKDRFFFDLLVLPDGTRFAASGCPSDVRDLRPDLLASLRCFWRPN